LILLTHQAVCDGPNAICARVIWPIGFGVLRECMKNFPNELIWGAIPETAHPVRFRAAMPFDVLRAINIDIEVPKEFGERPVTEVQDEAATHLKELLE
jgi:hypothetical protein